MKFKTTTHLPDNILYGEDGDDDLDGDYGDDDLDGDYGNDTLNGFTDDDYLSGGPGNDEILGNSGDDELKGGDGRDTLIGGEGYDTLTGGGGADTFYFIDFYYSLSGTFDTIASFKSGVDVIEVSSDGFSIDKDEYDAFEYKSGKLFFKDEVFVVLKEVEPSFNIGTDLIISS